MPAPEWRLAVEKVRRLALRRGRLQTGQFTLEGTRAMERALRNQVPVEEVLVSERFAASGVTREQEVLQEVQKAGMPLRIAPDDVVDGLTRGRGLGDVFAVMNCPSAGEWSSWLRPSGRTLWMVGWNLADPGNTGALIRTALAAGAAGFIAVGSTDPWHPKAVRTSMGSLFALPVRWMEEDDEWLAACREFAVEVFATDCREGEPLPQVKPSGERLALVMGSEATGLPQEVMAQVDRRVTIPMPAGVDSYSVNAAAAVLAYTLGWERVGTKA
jgi:TrmH family RNA methyltransferase